MPEWLKGNSILRCSTHNEGQLVIAERFIKTLKAKIYKKSQLIIIIIHALNKKPINADCSTLTEKIETNLKAAKFKLNDRVMINKYENTFS